LGSELCSMNTLKVIRDNIQSLPVVFFSYQCLASIQHFDPTACTWPPEKHGYRRFKTNFELQSKCKHALQSED
jgi:hypothetical protein